MYSATARKSMTPYCAHGHLASERTGTGLAHLRPRSRHRGGNRIDGSIRSRIYYKSELEALIGARNWTSWVRLGNPQHQGSVLCRISYGNVLRVRRQYYLSQLTPTTFVSQASKLAEFLFFETEDTHVLRTGQFDNISISPGYWSFWIRADIWVKIGERIGGTGLIPE